MTGRKEDMSGSYWSTLLVLWLWQVRACLSYTYELKPQVTFSGRGGEKELVVGSFAGYGREIVGETEGKVVLADITYGCQGSNATLSRHQGRGVFIVVLELSECDDYLQAKKAKQDGASGVVLYYTSGSSKSGWSSGGDEQLSIPVAVVELWDGILDHLTGQETPQYTDVAIEGRHFAVAPQQRTFYFIVTAFCILILLSCLWFFTSYFRRCRYSLRNRRRQARAQNTARKAISKLKVRSYKASKGSQEVESCAVCLELYCNNDVIRILPCRHEFHKNCVDPWLKIKHTCPLCKGSITSKSRNHSSSSTATTTTTTDDRQRQRRTSTNSVTTPISPSIHSLASSSDSSSMSDTTVTQQHEMRLLSSHGTGEVAINLEETAERENAAPDTEIV